MLIRVSSFLPTFDVWEGNWYWTTVKLNTRLQRCFVKNKSLSNFKDDFFVDTKVLSYQRQPAAGIVFYKGWLYCEIFANQPRVWWNHGLLLQLQSYNVVGCFKEQSLIKELGNIVL